MAPHIIGSSACLSNQFPGNSFQKQQNKGIYLFSLIKNKRNYKGVDKKERIEYMGG